MPIAVQLSAASQTLLGRILTSKDSTITVAELKRSVGSLLVHGSSESKPGSDLTTHLDPLVRAGFVESIVKGRSQQLTIPEDSKRQVRELLGISDHQKVTWKTFQEHILVASALNWFVGNGAVRQNVATADGLRAAVIIKHFELPLPMSATLRQAVDMLAWKTLGLEETRPLQSGPVLSLLLGRTLGAVDRLDIPWRTRAAQLACYATRASNTSIREIRRSLLLHWLSGLWLPDQPDASHETESVTPEPGEFADIVNKLARRSMTGRFGDDKVFISHVWRAYRKESLAAPVSEEQFKQQLTAAYAAHKIQLSRADLPQLMDETDVRESETTLDGYHFHFIVIEGKA